MYRVFLTITIAEQTFLIFPTGSASHPINTPAGLRIRTVTMDVPSVRHQQRWLHQPGRAGWNNLVSARTNGPEAQPSGRRSEGPGTGENASIPVTGIFPIYLIDTRRWIESSGSWTSTRTVSSRSKSSWRPAWRMTSLLNRYKCSTPAFDDRLPTAWWMPRRRPPTWTVSLWYTCKANGTARWQ